MPEMSDFGSEEYPLRCSALPTLPRCTWRATMLHLGLISDDSGKAADTGSAVHRAVEVWHKEKDVAGALAAVRAHLSDFPQADLDEVRLHFTPYANDPRNAECDLVHNELPVKFRLPPHESDPTGSPIFVRGTLDQIRRERGQLFLWDVKTSQKDGWTLAHEHALQLAAYCRGASETLGVTVYPGGIIRTRGYRTRGAPPAETRPPGVFFGAPFATHQIDALLESVRLAVAQIRGGSVQLGPGEWCSYCPAMGLDSCLPMLEG